MRVPEVSRAVDEIARAAECGDLAAIEQGLAQGVSPNSRVDGYDDGISLLDHALYKGQYDVARLLIRRGADVNIRGMGGTTPLHGAAKDGQMAAVRLLLDSGANPNLGDDMGDTPLHYAAGEGHADVVRVLIANAAKVNAANSYGETAMNRAIGLNKPQVISLLQSYGGRRG